jgi:hypothetical protein
MTCKGLHCPGCGDGGGGAAAVVLVVLAVIIAAIARPVAHAAGDVLRVLTTALEVTAIAVASVLGLAALAGMAYGAALVYRWHARNRQAIPRHTPAVQRVSWTLSAPRRRVIEPRPPAITRLASRHETRDRR